jgi:acyl dehydratase
MGSFEPMSLWGWTAIAVVRILQCNIIHLAPFSKEPPAMLPATQTLYFEDLSIGMSETYAKEVKSSDVIGFAEISGDRNPIHLSEHFAAQTPFKGRIAHGLYTASLISAVISRETQRPTSRKKTSLSRMSLCLPRQYLS